MKNKGKKEGKIENNIKSKGKIIDDRKHCQNQKSQSDKITLDKNSESNNRMLKFQNYKNKNLNLKDNKSSNHKLD